MPSRASLWLVGGFVLSLSLDFRSETIGGGMAQLVMPGLAAAFWLAATLSLRGGAVLVSPMLSRLNWLCVGLIAYAALGAWMNAVPLGNFLRLELRFVLMAMAVHLAARWLLAGHPLWPLLAMTLLAATISMAWTLVYTLGVRDLAIIDARYQLAPVTVFVALGLALPLAFKGKPLAIAICLAALVVLALSATRSYLLALVAIGVIVVAVALLQRRWALLGGMLAVVFAGLAIVPLAIGTPALALWTARFTTEQAILDPTLLTRLAEFSDQMRLWRETPWSVMFGRGLGAPFSWDIDIYRPVYLLDWVPYVETRFEFGHSLWVYSLFSLGLLGGWILPTILLSGLWQSARLVLARAAEPADVGLLLVLAAMLTTSFFNHPFGSRLMAVLTGIVLAAIAYRSDAVRQRLRATIPRYRFAGEQAA